MTKSIKPAGPANDPSLDRIIWRADLCTSLGVGSECVRRWIKDGKLPEPDINLSSRTKAWRLSTLQAAGIRIL
jgi:hypothetical protein